MLADEQTDTAQDLRERLASLLASGLETQWKRRAYSSEEIARVLERLQRLAPDDYAAKLREAGFTATPYRPPENGDLEQCCATCMYFERHKQFCDLPELELPVKPEWSCVLWRI